MEKKVLFLTHSLIYLKLIDNGQMQMCACMHALIILRTSTSTCNEFI